MDSYSRVQTEMFRELGRHVARSAVPLGARALGISRELPGAFDVGSADAARALAFNGAAADALAEQLELARQGGGSKAVARHVEKNGKVLVRDRIRSLVDEGAPFLEFSQLAGLGLYGHAVPAAGLVTGIGVIRGQQCVLIANDATVKGGTIYPIGVKKQLRAQEIARQNALPVIYLVDSGGAFLPLQDEIFADKEMGGRTFYNEANLSGAGVPQLALVCGSCTAGGAYVPAMADESVIIKRIGSVYLGGPPLVLAATGEVVTSEELGGADVHCAESGLCDHYVETEAEGIGALRDLVGELNYAPRQRPLWEVQPRPEQEPPLHDAADIAAMLPPPRPLIPGPGSAAAAAAAAGAVAAGRGPVPMRAVLARLLDGSRLVEVKARYGTSLLAGFAKVHGHRVGVVANAEETLCAKGSRKGAQFVQLCNERNLPIVFLHHCSAVASLRESALMMQAVACSTVPHIAIVAGDSIGPANFVMGGRSQSPRFMYAWPGARVLQAAAEEEEEVAAAAAAAAAGGSDDAEPAEAALRGTGGAFYGSARLWDDGVITPAETRHTLKLSLEAARCILHERSPPRKAPVFRM